VYMSSVIKEEGGKDGPNCILRVHLSAGKAWIALSE
jgi:hypothetical protein